MQEDLESLLEEWPWEEREMLPTDGDGEQNGPEFFDSVETLIERVLKLEDKVTELEEEIEELEKGSSGVGIKEVTYNTERDELDITINVNAEGNPFGNSSNE